VYTIPVESGVTRNLTRTSGIAERDPAWSPDGKWIAYFSDRSGEYELCLRRSDGKDFEGADEPEGNRERRLTSLGRGWKFSPVWSPDSEQIVYTTNAGAIHLYDLETDEPKEIGRASSGFPPRVQWSADSGWLTWSHRHSESRLDAVYLYDVASDERHEVTSGLFDDSNPTFDRSGDWLYFQSARTFEPIYADLDTTWIYANSHNLCAVPLRADVENPWAPENQEEEIEGEGDDDDENEEDGEDEEDGGDAGEGAEESADEEDEDEDEEPMTIDVEGFESRLMILPVDAGRFGGLEGADGKLVYLRFPRTGSDGGEAKLCIFDIAAEKKEDRKEKVVLENCQGFELTAKGDKVLVLRGDDAALVDLAAEQEFEAIAKNGLVATIDPREEWAQILKDAWRIYRDFFYDAGLHGVDWDAIGARYAGVLVDATSREDVHWLIGEMMAELNVGHAYNSPPPDMPSSGSARPVGLLGCDWEIENGAYRIAHILGGGAYDADARSPLARHGVDAAVGDYLLAVNGQPVDASRNVYSAFAGTAGKPTVLTLNTAPTMDGNEREILVEPIQSEVSLRYRQWVAENRDLVSELSDGRIGYIHVPSTARNGQNELMRQFLGQQHKDALIIDERWNSGGQIPTRFIELLNRPITNYWATRHGEDWTWPPMGHRGPKAMLINGAAGSGGDCFPYYFRQAGLGTLIGMRTWGGLIGISGNPGLIDGANPSVPTFGFYELDGTWGVEGHGVEPDIEVIDDPAQMQDGRDPQLLAAIEHLIGQLEGWPFDVRIRPAGANRSGVGVKPEDR
ncbi:MAG: PDZ domain-containing protein, partial [Planctomycetota bacterium]|nr:PDZ domain-containing protein [Planctomycetota bacterium]